MNNYKVYKHNFPNGKCYIGMTSREISQRWKSGYGYAKCVLMEEALLEFGWRNVTTEILFDNLSSKEAREKEVAMIEQYKSYDPEFGYNVARGAGKRIGVALSEETKAKIALGNKLASQTEETKRKKRESHLGKKLTPETIAKMKATCASRPKKEKAPKLPKAPEEFGKRVLQLDPTTNEVIKEWNNVKEICSTLGIAQAGVSRVCSGKYPTYKGFAWKYVEKTPKTKKIKK